MSYCRFGEESDVYVYTDGAELHCCACRMTDKRSDFLTARRTDMIEHLEQHIRHGHEVPRDAFERLRREIGQIAVAEESASL